MPSTILYFVRTMTAMTTVIILAGPGRELGRDVCRQDVLLDLWILHRHQVVCSPPPAARCTPRHPRLSRDRKADPPLVHSHSIIGHSNSISGHDPPFGPFPLNHRPFPLNHRPPLWSIPTRPSAGPALRAPSAPKARYRRRRRSRWPGRAVWSNRISLGRSATTSPWYRS